METVVSTFADVVAGAEVPLIAGKPQAQGDVLFVPTTTVPDSAVTVPAAGIILVTGNGGHHHTLLPEAGVTVRYTPIEGKPNLADSTTSPFATIVVAPGAEAGISHPEHGLVRLGGGETGFCYEVRRQREGALDGEIRNVAD